MTEFTGIRPSNLARTWCARSAVYQGLGTEPDPQRADVEDYWFRGRVFEEIVVRQLIKKHGRENVQRQVVIPFPELDAEGHADAYLTHLKTLVEVKSTSSPYPAGDTFQAGVRQLKLYLYGHPEAEEGLLLMIDPNRFRPADEYPVRLLDEDREEIGDLIATVQDGRYYAALRAGPPDRTCARPSEGRNKFCPYVNTCFVGWEEPFETLTDPETLDLVGRLAELKDKERWHKRQAEDLETQRRQVQAELDDLIPAGKSQIGSWVVTRIDKPGRRTFQENAARAAGFPVDALAEFYKTGDGWTEYRLTRADTPTDIDYGTEAPF